MNVVVVLNWHSIQLAVLVNYLAYYLQLVVRVTLNVGLERFLHNYFVLQVLNFDLNLKWVPFKNHELISKVI